MAIDEVLLQTAQMPTLRVYRWSEPTVSLGYFGKWEETSRTWPGMALVRRWTGGGVVPHGEDFTFTVVVPRAHPFASLTAGETYRLLHERVRATLTGRVPVTLAPGAAPRVSAECFNNPVQYDLVAESGKVAGGAQRRTIHGLLHQGSIQVPGLDEAFAGELARSLSERQMKVTLTAALVDRATELATSKYGSEAWLRRR